MEKGGRRRTNYGKFSSSIHEKTLRRDSPLGSHLGPSFRPGSGTGLQSNKDEDSGSENQNSQGVCNKEPPKEFHYRYDTPGQDDLNHNGGYTSAQSLFFHENKMSSSSCSTSKWICSQRVNAEPFQDEHGSCTGKHPKIYLTCNTDPAAPSPQSRFLRIPGIQSLCDQNSMEEMESKVTRDILQTLERMRWRATRVRCGGEVCKPDGVESHLCFVTASGGLQLKEIAFNLRGDSEKPSQPELTWQSPLCFTMERH